MVLGVGALIVGIRNLEMTKTCKNSITCYSYAYNHNTPFLSRTSLESEVESVMSSVFGVEDDSESEGDGNSDDE